MIIYGAHYVSGLELGSGDKAVTTVRMASAPQLWGRGDEGLQTRREYRAAWTGVFERRHRLLQEYTVGAPDSHGGVGVGKVSQRTRKKKKSQCIPTEFPEGKRLVALPPGSQGIY